MVDGGGGHGQQQAGVQRIGAPAADGQQHGGGAVGHVQGQVHRGLHGTQGSRRTDTVSGMASRGSIAAGMSRARYTEGL